MCLWCPAMRRPIQPHAVLARSRHNTPRDDKELQSLALASRTKKKAGKRLRSVQLDPGNTGTEASCPNYTNHNGFLCTARLTQRVSKGCRCMCCPAARSRSAASRRFAPAGVTAGNWLPNIIRVVGDFAFCFGAVGAPFQPSLTKSPARAAARRCNRRCNRRTPR